MPSLQYRLFSRLVSKFPLKVRLNILFFRRFSRFIDFNTPVTFNEKIQLRKVCQREPVFTVAAGKIQSKELVKTICPEIYCPETLWVGSSVSEINELNFSQLPLNYVFKGNHTSQTLRIIRRGEHLNRNDMESLTRDWLRHDQSATLGEWAYKNVPKQVFIEEYLDFNGVEPDDYKFFVYHGKVHFIQLDSDRFSNHKRNMFDRSWNDLGFDYSHERKMPTPSKPEFLEQMIKIAEKIGTDFDFIRVDLYFYNNQVTFGELTVYPGAGFEKFPSQELDKMFGQPWNI